MDNKYIHEEVANLSNEDLAKILRESVRGRMFTPMEQYATEAARRLENLTEKKNLEE
jgi:predicted nucleic acid-binding protein